MDIDFLKKCNHCLNLPTYENKKRTEFFELANEDFNLAVKKYLTPNKKIALDIYYSLPLFIKKGIKKIIKKDSLKKMW